MFENMILNLNLNKTSEALMCQEDAHGACIEWHDKIKARAVDATEFVRGSTTAKATDESYRNTATHV